MHAEARRLLQTLGVDIDTRTLVHELGVAQQQVVEIAKALSQNARILVMDEPTAALSEHEIDRPFTRIRAPCGRRRLHHLYSRIGFRRLGESADRVTVMRDGRTSARFARRRRASTKWFT
jgi:ribose transport system ATP-binding protein